MHNDTLGTKAIEKFDVAMKSKCVLTKFRTYIEKHHSHYSAELIMISNSGLSSTKTNQKVGVSYLYMFHLITIFNSLNFQMAAAKKRVA
jgi:hypothetical protein